MITVTNDWRLKTLPNNDISTPNSYTNAISCEVFEPVTRLLEQGQTYAENKYLTASTGIDIPVYQVNLEDFSYYNSLSSGLGLYLWNNTSNAGLESHFDYEGKPRQYTSTRIRTIDSYNYENEYTVCGGTSSNKVPIKFEFFNPTTKQYDKELTLKYNQEYKNYISGSSGTKRTYKNRYSYYWADNNDNRYYIFESPHLNIDPSEHYPASSGDALIGRINVYMSADIGFDVINEEWVGLLNLFLAPVNAANYGKFTADDTFSAYSFQYIDVMGYRYAKGPYNDADYVTAVGTMDYNMGYFYRRAFKLSNYTPTIESATIPTTKLGCYGPTTRVIM